MRKYLTAAVALTLIASMLGGCRNGNVSDRNDGVITDPTVTSGTMATMPSTDTTPIATTNPSVSTESTTHPGNENSTATTDMTENSGAADHSGVSDATGDSGNVEGRTRQSGSRNPMNMH